MEKWADYCISKISWDQDGNLTLQHNVHVDNGDTVGVGSVVSRYQVVNAIINGFTFVAISKNEQGNWTKTGQFVLDRGYLSWGIALPYILPRRKTFCSYFHKDDQYYKNIFENLTSDLIINKSVKEDEINSDNKDTYIKYLIQNDYISDVSVLVVLVGQNTKYRKHVDWEISGALDIKVGGSYAGVLGLLLPTHPDYGNDNYYFNNLPKRLAENAKSGYAIMRDWTTDRFKLQNYIEKAFSNRIAQADKRVNRKIPQLKVNVRNF